MDNTRYMKMMLAAFRILVIASILYALVFGWAMENPFVMIASAGTAYLFHSAGKNIERKLKE